MKPIIKSWLDVDFYKLTMSQHQWTYHPDVEVRFGFTNRTKVRLAEFVDMEELRLQIDNARKIGFRADQIQYLRSLKGKSGKNIFGEGYLRAAYNLKQLPAVRLGIENGQLVIETEGRWWIVTLWETIIMSIVNEMYFAELVRQSNRTLADVYAEGMRRLDRKIQHLKGWPSVKFSDFGTRRRFSREWHEMVYDVLMNEFGDEARFIGTSNVELAMKYSVNIDSEEKVIERGPMGTFAHEEMMVNAALNDDSDEALRASQKQFLLEWQAMYQPELLIGLSDTFGSEAFFEDFKDFANAWGGMRHDSGDPFEFGNKVIEYYKSLGIDPMWKAIVFSDGLTEKTMTELFYEFQDKIWMVFGWGTNLTNDLGFDALSIVMKAVAARRIGEIEWRFTVKLSDNPKKAMSGGGQKVIERYIRVFGAVIKRAIETIY